MLPILVLSKHIASLQPLTDPWHAFLCRVRPFGPYGPKDASIELQSFKRADAVHIIEMKLQREAARLGQNGASPPTTADQQSLTTRNLEEARRNPVSCT